MLCSWSHFEEIYFLLLTITTKSKVLISLAKHIFMSKTVKLLEDEENILFLLKWQLSFRIFFFNEEFFHSSTLILYFQSQNEMTQHS